MDSLLSATEKFRPGGNTVTASSTDIDNTIRAICSPAMATSCPDSLMRGELAQFYSQCQKELTTTPNENVIDIYQVLFALSPLKKAVCSKDDNDNYCIRQKIGSNSPGSSNMQSVLNSLVITNPRSATVTPNMTTYRDLNIAFLDLTPGLDQSTLCTTCTRQIFNSYYNFEMASPFAPGLSASTLLGGQMDLYHAIQDKCGPNFLQTNIQAAGGISGNSLFSGAAHSAVDPGFFLAVCGLVTIIFFAI
ncbi:hypothetical protein APHAL10511_007558 [Amanita phalloides]|nr:hypothetical protein APHAL10511_007558 [Amanita phalloides]